MTYKSKHKPCKKEKSLRLSSGASLDTLAQLGTESKSLYKKAASKYLSNGISLSLITYLEGFENRNFATKIYTKKQLSANQNFGLFGGEDPKYLTPQTNPVTWVQKYWNTFHCATTLKRNGQSVTSTYCGNRWCVTCNRIRTAKLIKGYRPELQKMEEPFFVTLTVPNCRENNLKKTIEKMQSDLKKVVELNKRHFQRNKINYRLEFLRKIEITYNSIRNDYHPHFHLVVDGEQQANYILNSWLERNHNATSKAQNITKVYDIDSQSMELFKYFTKIVTSQHDGTSYKQYLHVHSLHVIFQAIEGKRTFQPVNIRMRVDEDIDEIQKQEITDYDFSEEELNDIYIYNFSDWYSMTTGEALTGYKENENLNSINVNLNLP